MRKPPGIANLMVQKSKNFKFNSTVVIIHVLFSYQDNVNQTAKTYLLENLTEV